MTGQGLRRWQFAAAFAVVLAAAWVVARPFSAYTTLVVTEVLLTAAPCLAAAVCLTVARRLSAGRVAWLLIGLGCAAWGVGELIWDYDRLVRQVSMPFPSGADVGYLLFVPLAIAGILALPGRPRSSAGKARLLLDALITTTALTITAWEGVFEPVYRASPTDVLAKVVTLAYPAGDLMMLALLIAAIAQQTREARAGLLMLGAGVAAFVFADVGFAVLATTNDYSSDNPIGIGWFAGFLLISLAGLSQRRTSSDPPVRTSLPGMITTLPYAVVGCVVVVSAHRFAESGRVGPVIAPLLITLVALGGLRQALAAIENDRLTRQLEERVIARTRELAHQAWHDPLTGLPNRALLTQSVAAALDAVPAGERPPILLLLDLDGFKKVNDTLGHSVGDDLLRQVSGRLGETVGPADVLVRLGGDEFAVLLLDADRAGATALAHRILDRVSGAYDLAEREVRLAASIGVACAGDETEETTDLLRDADLAMYAAKSAGRGRVCVFEPELRARAEQRLELESALRRALVAGELSLAYQPVVDLDDGRCVGAEALLRWHSVDGRVISPAEFIPVAEDSGLIVPLGEWVLEQACSQAAQWRGLRPAGSPLVVTVNVAVPQLHDPGFAGYVEGVLARHELPGEVLTLELTESVFMEETGVDASVLQRLRALGVRIALDDFGTGYSSLGYLRRFPVDALKIDRRFVAGLVGEAGDDSVTAAILGLATSLDLFVIAEGVETPAQLDRLRALGCSYGQGFGLHRPAPPAAITSILSRDARLLPERTLVTMGDVVDSGG